MISWRRTIGLSIWNIQLSSWLWESGVDRLTSSILNAVSNWLSGSFADVSRSPLPPMKTGHTLQLSLVMSCSNANTWVSHSPIYLPHNPHKNVHVPFWRDNKTVKSGSERCLQYRWPLWLKESDMIANRANWTWRKRGFFFDSTQERGHSVRKSWLSLSIFSSQCMKASFCLRNVTLFSLPLVLCIRFFLHGFSNIGV